MPQPAGSRRPDATWGRLPGRSAVVVPPLFDTAELVAHQDYCPGNVVFRDHRAVALIDFDLARPTTRVADCVNAMYWWTPLTDPRDRTDPLRNADIGRRCRVFADAYGLSRAQREQVAGVALQGARNSLVTMRAAADADEVFRRWWDEGVGDRLRRGERWTTAHADGITAALLD
jgi:aminoglycoside phosphotransferase (APT) family kinase protein